MMRQGVDGRMEGGSEGRLSVTSAMEQRESREEQTEPSPQPRSLFTATVSLSSGTLPVRETGWGGMDGVVWMVLLLLGVLLVP